jgi:hypothetical protein
MYKGSKKIFSTDLGFKVLARRFSQAPSLSDENLLHCYGLKNKCSGRKKTVELQISKPIFFFKSRSPKLETFYFTDMYNLR